jgi:hypothetical protein
MPESARLFVLSPARLDGKRARMLFEPRTDFGLAQGLRSREGVPIGHVFRFLSGLYFRGKLAYAERFARPAQGVPWIGSGALVITQSRGLVPVESRVCIEHLEEFAEVNVDPGEPRFFRPLMRDAERLREALGPEGEAVLLGSIATRKYTEPLTRTLGTRLFFPREFVGRGDMSRGGLLLRCVDANAELTYVPVATEIRRGARPPRLGRRSPRPERAR